MIRYVPDYLVTGAFYRDIWPLIVIPTILSILFGLLLANIEQRINRGASTEEQIKEKRLIYIIILGSLSMTGTVVGFLIGTAIGQNSAILPAVLSLVGGLIVFGMSRSTNGPPATNGSLVGKYRENRIIMSASIFLFSLLLLVGNGWGNIRLQEAQKTEEIRMKQTQLNERQEQYDLFISNLINKNPNITDEDYRKQLVIMAIQEAKVNTVKETIDAARSEINKFREELRLPLLETRATLDQEKKALTQSTDIFS